MKKCHADVIDIVEHSINEIAADAKSRDLVKARTALILCLVRGLVSQVSSMERTQRSMEKRQKYIQLRLEGEIEKVYPWDRLVLPRRTCTLTYGAADTSRAPSSPLPASRSSS